MQKNIKLGMRFFVIVVLLALLIVPSVPVFASGTNTLTICSAQVSYLGPPYPHSNNFKFYGPYGSFFLFNDTAGNEACHVVGYGNMPAGSFTVTEKIYYGWTLLPAYFGCYSGKGTATYAFNYAQQSVTITFPLNNAEDAVCSFGNYDTTIGFH